ncbi:MAG: DUF4345 domain-containing protein [Chloroflexota bacterium]
MKRSLEAIARPFLYVITAVIYAVGLMYSIDPAGSMEAAEVSINSAAGRTEIRGIYAGLHFALATYIFINLRRGLLQSGLLLIGLAFGFAALGRLVGFSVEGAAGIYNLVVTLIEIGVSGMAFFLLRSMRYSQTASQAKT